LLLKQNITTSTYLSDSTTIINGVIACNKPDKNEPLFVNFIAFRSNDKKYEEGPIQLISPNLVYLFHEKFVYTMIKNSDN
jgi:hypothetical protein